MSETKVHKYPIGTIRNWEVGDVIKAHDNSIFDNGWMLIPDTPAWLLELMLNMDTLGRSIVGYKSPIDGELWLKKVINEFQSPSGEKYKLEEFQQYKGFFGAGAYSFRNVFSKRYFNNKINLKDKINNALIDENEKYWRELRNNEPDKYGSFDDRRIYLSKDKIKSIKEQIKLHHKYDESDLDPRDVKALGGLLVKVNDFLKKGTNLEGDEKEVYDRNNHIKNTFLDEYLPLKTKRFVMQNAIEEINEKFGDNWGIKESFRKQFQEQFDKYVHKNMDRIKIDELSNFQAELGCDLAAPIDTFYKCLNALQVKYAINLNDYIGKNVPDPYDKYQDVRLLSVNPLKYQKSNGIIEEGWYTNDKEKVIEKMIASREVGDMQLPLQIRFDQLYNKNIKGKWDFEEAIALKAMEQVINYLPPGHCLTNNDLINFDKDDAMGSSVAYACYGPAKRQIFLSESCLSSASRMVSLNSGDEFASVMIHEIGHAVEQKLGLRKSLAYKKFGYQAGWNWDTYAGRSVFSTGHDKSIPRNNKHANEKLITKYAQKSPSEAFAEYYSFYSQYKHEVDQFLDHKDTKGLKKHIDVHIPEANPNEVVLRYGDFSSISPDVLVFDKMTAVLLAQKRDLEEHFNSDIFDPWEATKNETLLSVLDKTSLRKVLSLNRDKEQTIPVFSIKTNDGKHQLVNDTELHVNEANKYLKNYTPTYTCSQEAYTLLKKANFTDHEISSYTLHQNKDKQVPVINKETGVSSTEGLRYRSKVVPYQTLIKNEEIFREMRNIYYSDELKKALDDLLHDKNDNNQEVQKSDSNESILINTDQTITKQSIIGLFKKHILNPITKSLGGIINTSDLAETIAGQMTKVENKKLYADAIVLDENGRILLLKRAQGEDHFHPNKWCLPGGNVDSGEEGVIAAVRELGEETNLESELQFVSQYETDNAIIQYFFGRSDANPNIIIDNKEHADYAWVDLSDLGDYEMILDLKDKLCEIFDLTLKTNEIITPEIDQNDFADIQILTFEKAFEEISKSYDEGLISDEVYFDALKKFELIKFNKLSIEEKFEKGLITEEELFKAIQSKKIDDDDDDDDPTEDIVDDNQDENQSEDVDDDDDTHGKTGLSFDKLRQFAMTTPQEQLEAFIKQAKDPELRKIAHDELARRLADEHPQEDDDSSKKSVDKKDQKTSKPSNAKESLNNLNKPADDSVSEDNNDGPDVADIHKDPEYEDKAGQYAQAISSGEDPTQNPFLADFAQHIEDKKKDFKPLDIVVDVPDFDNMPNNESNENQSNVEADKQNNKSTKKKQES